jgi:asparagine synthase (glutamine-hydrolysing)
MCGIVAIFAYSDSAPPVDGGELTLIRDQMTARGPDGAGALITPDGRVGLGHRRLAIIDLSPTGAQPMITADGKLSIAFNGEIYNFLELRRELTEQGVVFRSHSDTEVLLHLYRRDGPRMVERLRGMFAFALWDEEKQGLLLARDHFGIKPLYIADDGMSLRAASQVKALLAGGKIDKAPDPAGHVGFFLLGSLPEPHTLYRHIRALPAGCWLWVAKGGQREERRFFDIPAEMANAEATSRSRPDPQLLGEALRDSISHHLIADVAVGVFLSSGLDSTTIAALAAESATNRLDTLTLGFEEFRGTAKDEVPLAEQVAEAYAANHSTRWITRGDFSSARLPLLKAMDQPSIDGVNSYFVAKAAREAGLKVALSGLGGDELFGGYDSFQQVPELVRLFRPLANYPGFASGLRKFLAPWIGMIASPKTAGLLEYGGSIPDAWFLRRGLYMPWELSGLMDEEIIREGWAALDLRHCLAESCKGVVSSRLKIAALEMQWYMKNQLLRDADWAGMAHSLEIRTPLVDVELFRRLLPLLANNHPPGKRDMALTPAKSLPTAILGRTKTGFFIPVREWLSDEPGSRKRGLRGWARAVYGWSQTVPIQESRWKKERI